MNGTFYEQLGGVAGFFEQWGACERTVVACALARRVPWPGLKLVQTAVEAALRSHVEDERLERDANDEVLIANLLSAGPDEDDDEEKLARLVRLLPLLRADNCRGKEAYVRGAAGLVRRSLAPRPADLARQLLTYLLVHPALAPRDHATLSQLLRHLENHIAGGGNPETAWHRTDPRLAADGNIWGGGGGKSAFRRTVGRNVEFRGTLDAESLQESFARNGRDVDPAPDEPPPEPRAHRSNSLTPPSAAAAASLAGPLADNLGDEPLVQKPRSFSLSSERGFGPLRPMGGGGARTTGSETRLDDLRARPPRPSHAGMSTVAQWLKSLRLHKYAWLFGDLSYERMVAIDEAHLERLGVTRGARHKLLLSIAKLGERDAALAAVEAELRAGGGAAGAGRALARLRTLLLAPMPPASPLPAAIVRALQLASECLGEGGGAPVAAGGGAGPGPQPQPPEEDPEPPVEPVSLHCWLIEKALHHESFSSPELQDALKRLRHRFPPRQFYHHVSDMPLNRRCLKPRWRVPNGAGYRRPWGHTKSGAPPPRGKSHSYPPYPGAAPPSLSAPRPSPAPTPSPTAPAPADDYSSLDALCLQMTEQAID